jgi:hypothetical protein
MRIIESLKAIGGFIVFISILVAGLAWCLEGAPLPGRYQIVSSSSDSVVMLDTVSGKIRLFSYRIGSSSHREFERKVEVFELTK